MQAPPSLASSPSAPPAPPHLDRDSATPALLPLLPNEILLLVFGHVSHATAGDLLDFSLTPETALSPRPGARHSSIMRSLALVSRQWHGVAAGMLYRNLTVHRPGQLSELVEQSGRCLPLVRHLRVLWNRTPGILPQESDLALVADLLDLCPNVDQITLAGDQFDLATPELLDALRRRSSPSSIATPIQRLSCCAIETPFFHQRQGPQNTRTSETIGALLLACPDLVEGRWDEFRSTFSQLPSLPGDVKQLSPKLEKVAFQRVVLESSNMERILCPLGGQLKELYLDRTSLATCEAFRMILQKVGENLEVLELKDCDFWATWESRHSLVDATLASCPKLRHLVLLGSLDSVIPTFPQVHEALESFTIGCRFVEPGSLATAIHRGFFPAHKKLHVEATCEWTDDGEAAVQAACVQAGIVWETGWNLD